MVEAHYVDVNKNNQKNLTGDSWITTNNTILNYISFDGNGINLNDSKNKTFLSEGDYEGWRSSLSNLGGVIPYGSDYPSITLSRSTGYFNFEKGITVSFYGDCCDEFEVEYEYENAIGGFKKRVSYHVTKDQFHFVPPKFEISYGDVIEAGKIHSIKFYFLSTKLPMQFVKINYIKLGEILVIDKLKNVELLEEINILSNDLPINSLSFSAIMDKNVGFESGTPINLYSNQRYYGTFFLDDWEKTSKNTYQIKASNAIRILDDVEYKEWSLGRTELLPNQIKNSTNVDIKLPQNVNYTAFGNLKPNTCRYALCEYAFALCLMIDGSRSQDVKLREIPKKISSVITTSEKRIIGNTVYKKKTPITSAKIEYADNVFTDTNLYPLQLKCTPNVRTLHYFDEPFEVEIANTTGVTIYSTADNYIDFISPSEEITLNGYKLQYFYNNVNIVNNKIPLNTKENSLDLSKLNLRGGTYGEDGWVHFLIDNKSSDILKYMQSPGTITSKIRLRGEKVGDLIQIDTAFDGVKTGIITSMNLHFGYEDTADIEVLEWPIG